MPVDHCQTSLGILITGMRLFFPKDDAEKSVLTDSSALLKSAGSKAVDIGKDVGNKGSNPTKKAIKKDWARPSSDGRCRDPIDVRRKAYSIFRP